MCFAGIIVNPFWIIHCILGLQIFLVPVYIQTTTINIFIHIFCGDRSVKLIAYLYVPLKNTLNCCNCGYSSLWRTVRFFWLVEGGGHELCWLVWNNFSQPIWGSLNCYTEALRGALFYWRSISDTSLKQLFPHSTIWWPLGPLLQLLTLLGLGGS